MQLKLILWNRFICIMYVLPTFRNFCNKNIPTTSTVPLSHSEFVCNWFLLTQGAIVFPHITSKLKKKFSGITFRKYETGNGTKLRAPLIDVAWTNLKLLQLDRHDKGRVGCSYYFLLVICKHEILSCIFNATIHKFSCHETPLKIFVDLQFRFHWLHVQLLSHTSMPRYINTNKFVFNFLCLTQNYFLLGSCHISWK